MLSASEICFKITAMEEKMAKKYMMIITHSTDDPHRACTAMGLASCLLVDGADVSLFFMGDGVKILQKGVADTIEGNNIAPVRDSLPILLEEKINLYACKVDLKTYDIPESELLEGVEVVALPFISEQMRDRETLMC
jgi:predicted peroxiredoxin